MYHKYGQKKKVQFQYNSEIKISFLKKKNYKTEMSVTRTLCSSQIKVFFFYYSGLLYGYSVCIFMPRFAQNLLKGLEQLVADE